MFLADASRIGISAPRAMRIAEDLYMGGWISYPRTDNTVYPKSLDIRGVLEMLRNTPFAKFAEEILAKGKIVPSRGKVESKDHPPIYPVRGASREDIASSHWRVYELVVRRFLATLGDSASYLGMNAKIKIGTEEFLLSGRKTLSLGWKKYYPYYSQNFQEIPEIFVGDKLHVRTLRVEEKTTKPPKHYTEATLLQTMEKLGLGTKSTRHDVLKKLYERRYVNKKLVPSTLALAVMDALKNYAEIITKPDMTSRLEEEMNEIVEGRKSKEDVVRDSIEMLRGVMAVLRENEEKIAASIKDALINDASLGKCPKCGSPIITAKSKKGKRFARCSNPECDVTYSLPQYGKIERVEDTCPICGAIMVRVIMRGKKPRIVCINRECGYEEKR